MSNREELIAKAKRKFLISQAREKFKANSKPTEYVEEVPKNLDYKHRLIAESLASSPEAKLDYYKKNYPNSDPRLEEDGRVTFKGEGNKRHFVDPNNGITDILSQPMETVRDVTEFLPSFGIGALNTAAEGIGGAVGSIGGSFIAPGAGTVVGGLTGAGLAGAASGDLLERGRQALGSYAGIPNNENQGEVDFARYAGLASPALLGFDKAGGKQVLKALGKNIYKGTGKKIFRHGMKTIGKDAYGRGLVGLGASAAKNKVFPALASAASAKSKNSIKTLLNDYSGIENSAKNERVGELVKNLEANAQDIISNKDREIKKRFGEALDVVSSNEGVKFDTSKILSPLQELSDRVKKNFNEDYVKAATDAGVELSDQASILKSFFFGAGKEKKQAERHIKELMKDTPTYKDLRYVEKNVDGLIKTSSGTMEGSRALRLKDDLNKISGIKKNSNKMGMDPLEQEVTNLSKVAAKEVDKGVMALPGNSSFQKVKKEYADWNKLKERSHEFFGNTGNRKYKPGKTTEGTIKKLTGSSSDVDKEAILDTAKALNLPFEKQASKIRTIKDFFDPSISPLSDTIGTASRAIPSSLALGGLGYFAGDAIGGNAVSRQGGAVAGAGLGTVMGGPKAIRMYIRNLVRASKAKNYVQKMSPISANKAFNIWAATQNQQGK